MNTAKSGLPSYVPGGLTFCLVSVLRSSHLALDSLHRFQLFFLLPICLVNLCNLCFLLWLWCRSKSNPESSEVVLEDNRVSSDDVSSSDSGLEEEVDVESDELESSWGFFLTLPGPFLLGRLCCSSSEDSSLSLELPRSIESS